MRDKLPSAFQPKEKVGLQTLINLLQNAKDGDVVSVQFTDTKVKYNISVPIILNREEVGQHGYFRMANIDAAFVHAPIDNGFFYNDQVAIESRKQADEERIRTENKKAFEPVDKVLDASWMNGDVLPSRVKSAGGYEGYTDDMLIDLDGDRKHFVVGWFDYDLKKWVTPEDKPVEPTMKWQPLPLAKYDKK